MIEVRGLSRTFGELQALSRVEFDVGEGEIFGFIGPNGAGKTTTIRILATLLLPSAGTARIMGHDVTREPETVRALLGYMPDRWGVYPDITVAEYLEFFAAAYAIPRRERSVAVEGVMELTDLGDLRGRLVDTLSKGMQQRLCLAKTLVHDPKLLILDEPADGLDPRARIELRELLRELASMGKTILISSHILTELSDLVTSVGIIERGEVLMSGEVGAIMQRMRAGEVSGLRAEEEPADLRRFVVRLTPETLGAGLELLRSRPDMESVAAQGERELRFAYRGPEEDVAGIVRALVQGGADVLGLREDRADLEDVFMAITQGNVQ